MRCPRRWPGWTTALAAAAVASLVLVGCSSDPEPRSVAMMSEVRPASSEVAPPELDADLDDLDLDGLDDLFAELDGLADELEGAFDADEFTELFEGLTPEDLGIDPGELGLSGVEDCFEELLLYSQLMVAALGMGGAATTERVAGELRSQLPPELHRDLDVVVAALSGASFSDLVNESGPLASPEFERSNEAIAQWLATECGTDGA